MWVQLKFLNSLTITLFGAVVLRGGGGEPSTILKIFKGIVIRPQVF